MKELQRNWRIEQLGNICQTGAGGTPRKSVKEYYEGGTIRWLLSGEVSQGEIFDSKKFITEQGLKNSSAKIFPANTVLVAMYGATAGQVGILRCDASTNQAICGIYPNNKLQPEYIFYAILSKKSKLIATATGNAQPNISQAKIKKLEIPVPTLPEQKRIVAILDEAFAGIDQAIANTEKNLANAREVFESYLNEVFTQKGTDWIATSLVNEIELLTGFAFKSKDYSEEPDGIRLLRGDNIVQGTFRWESAKKWSANDLDSYTKYYLRAGDVVLAMDRTWVKAGLKYAQIGEKDLPCLLVQRVARLRPKSDLDSNFLKYLISSKEFTKYVLSIQTGSGVPHISGAQIKAFQFGKPTTAIQKKISAELDKLHLETQHLESIYQKKLNALAELKQSILHKAFTGGSIPKK
ncbi:MAG: restriction endonuclease subunit S [Candidatus Electrothrix sp. AUS3]|nr:restriction endonuclease subunit S [Candidatus Electrothrix gigas]